MPLFSPPRNPSSPFMTMKGDHAGLRVADLNSALAWYQQKLDFRLTGTLELGGVTYAYMAPANDQNFQIELVAGMGAVDRPSHKDLDESQNLHGWHHVCMRVDNVDAAVAALTVRGVKVIAGPMDIEELKRRIAFFEDAWGNIFELTQPHLSLDT